MIFNFVDGDCLHLQTVCHLSISILKVSRMKTFVKKNFAIIKFGIDFSLSLVVFFSLLASIESPELYIKLITITSAFILIWSTCYNKLFRILLSLQLSFYLVACSLSPNEASEFYVFTCAASLVVSWICCINRKVVVSSFGMYAASFIVTIVAMCTLAGAAAMAEDIKLFKFAISQSLFSGATVIIGVLTSFILLVEVSDFPHPEDFIERDLSESESFSS